MSVCISGGLSTAMEVLLGLTQRKWVSPATMANVTVQQLQEVISKHHTGEGMAQTIVTLVGKLNAPPFSGQVPQTKTPLLQLVCDHTASLLMAQVFASTELVIGLHTRKIVCALDLYDWEESGTTSKSDVKMTSIPTAHVRKSLKTWMPKGIGRDLNHVMDSLGAIIGEKQQGEWGKVKSTINNSFPSKEKQNVLDMVLSISQFYHATKCKQGTRPPGI